MDRLYKSKEDFLESVDRGIKHVTNADFPAPSPEHEDQLKDLLSVFLAATIEMDPSAFASPDLPQRLASVKMALLAAYHLGKNDARR